MVGPRSCAFRIVNTRYLASHGPTRGRHRHGSLLRALCSGGGARSFTCVLRLQFRAIKCAARSHARVRWLDRPSVRVPLSRMTKDPDHHCRQRSERCQLSHSGALRGRQLPRPRLLAPAAQRSARFWNSPGEATRPLCCFPGFTERGDRDVEHQLQPVRGRANISHRRCPERIGCSTGTRRRRRRSRSLACISDTGG
jgi:hypothetical protein